MPLTQKIKIIKHTKIVDLYHSKEAQEALKKDTKDGEKAVDLSQKEIKDIEDSLK